MLELVLSIIACFLSVCGFLMGAGAVITVIGWSRSTHKIVQVAAEPTQYRYDLPPEAQPAEALSEDEKEYIRRAREAELSAYDDE